jgi:hypothetical protein
VKNSVIGSNPVPESNRNKIISKTGRCIARKNCKENFLTFVRQYPKGILIINVNNVSRRMFILNKISLSELSEKFLTGQLHYLRQ